MFTTSWLRTCSHSLGRPDKQGWADIYVGEQEAPLAKLTFPGVCPQSSDYAKKHWRTHLLLKLRVHRPH